MSHSKKGTAASGDQDVGYVYMVSPSGFYRAPVDNIAKAYMGSFKEQSLEEDSAAMEKLINKTREEIGLPTRKILCTCAVISSHEAFKYQHEVKCPLYIPGVKQ